MRPPFDSRRRLLVQGLLATPAMSLLPAACSRKDDPHLIHDVSQLDSIQVAQVRRPKTLPELLDLVSHTRGAVSIGGGRYSMGGQIAAEGSLHLDMRGLNRLVRFDPASRRVRVQAGMRWRDLQELIDPYDLSVRIMQSYSNFTVGGSVSVNCHGRYVGRGPLINSVRALQLVTAEGGILELSRTLHSDLFAAVFGGYGGLGVVTEVELELDDNTPIERHAQRIALEDYPVFFREEVLRRPEVVLHNADLVPPRFDQPLAISWARSERALTQSLRLVPRNVDYGREQNLIWAVSELPGSSLLREREVTRSLLEEPTVVWRNYEASLDTASLEPRTRAMSTYLLQEYFIPVARFLTFAKSMARTLAAHDVNALNVSIRHSPPDELSLLRWAPEEVFSFVIYYKQRSHANADAAAATWTRELIEAALACGGRYYLPYRLHASASQFKRSYPEVTRFAALKRQIDPGNRFRNRLLDKYLPS